MYGYWILKIRPDAIYENFPVLVYLAELYKTSANGLHQYDSTLEGFTVLHRFSVPLHIVTCYFWIHHELNIIVKYKRYFIQHKRV